MKPPADSRYRESLAPHSQFILTPFTLDPAVQLAAPAVLLQEGVEGGEAAQARRYSIT
jgi:hypothetical protein